ncbi:uncharacterized protein isoform X2 [Rhodnius prolixus]|uniref:uncharacterized protein isoform X2 n=1 Tax=Rhodnius prolixus TaxID=13249 RepID=UPI003D18B392
MQNVKKSRRAGIRKTEQPFVRQNYDSPYLQPLHHKQAAVTRKKVKVKRKLRGVTGEYRDIVRPDSDESGVPVDPKVTEEFIEQVDSICESLTENKGKLPTIPTWEETFLEALISTQAENNEAEMEEEKPNPPREDAAPEEEPVAAQAEAPVAEETREEPAKAAPTESPKESTEEPTKEPAIAPTKETTEEPSKVPPKESAKESTEAPTKETTKEPGEPLETAEDFPLADSKVMEELREADAKAQKTAEIIQAMKKELAVLAQKEKMTSEDAQMIERKQAELMDKLSEFEQITKQVQRLVGLTDITSKMIVEQRAADHRQATPRPAPEESLPKVIICGGGSIDPVPKIIVCEPTNRRECGQPLYQQLSGRKTRRDVSPRGGRGAVCGKGGAGQRDHVHFEDKPCAEGGRVGGGGGGGGGGLVGMGGGYQQPQMGPQWGGSGGGGTPYQIQWQDQQQVFPSGHMGAWPPPHHSQGRAPISDTTKDVTNCTIIKLSTPRSCSPDPKESAKTKKSGGDKGEKKNVSSTKGKDKKTKESEKEEDAQNDKKCKDLKKKVECLESQVKSVKKENKQLKNKLGVGKVVEICKNEMMSRQVCRADINKQLGTTMAQTGKGCNCKKFQKTMMGPNSPCRQKLFDITNADVSGDTGNKNCKKADSKNMENVVRQMEAEVRAIQKELEMVQAERRGLELQKKLLTCTAAAPVKGGGDEQPSAPKIPNVGVSVPLPGVVPPVPINVGVAGPSEPICPSTGKTCAQEQAIGPPPPCKRQAHHMVSTTSSPSLKVIGPPLPSPQSSPPCVVALEAQLSSLREQYRKLQCDFNCKVEEVSIMRCELESAKRESLSSLEKCQEAESKVDDLLERLRAAESEKMKMSGSQNQVMEVEQQLTLAKQRYRESQEELEESRAHLQETCGALEEYRNKYLNAQQTVEEQRRQLDIMEIENNRISEHINMELKRVKVQFQEKLEELTPLPEMLKIAHQKLHESQQLRAISERSVEQFNKETTDLKAEKAKLLKQLEEYKKGYTATDAEKANLQSSLNNGEKKVEEMKAENTKLKATVTRLEELALDKDRRLDEKVHEASQLSTQLETLREESARQVSRTKDRCESVRRCLQGQISELEKQLAQSRAAAKTAQMDRDEIRAKMQTQIQCLNENFNQAQLRIRSLQTNVNYLKNSYTNIFAPDRPPIGPLPLDVCGHAP